MPDGDQKVGLLEALMKWGSGEYSHLKGQGGIDNATLSIGDKENEILKLMQKHDPNAKWRYVEGGQANEGGGMNPGHYELDFDQNLLPKGAAGDKTVFSSGGSIINTAYLGQNATDADWRKANLIQPDAVWFDENYGYQTHPKNWKPGDGVGDKLAKFAPMAIVALATMGAGAPLMAGLSGAITAAGGTAVEAAIVQSMMSLISNQGLNFKSGANILSNLLGAAGVPGASFGKYIPTILNYISANKSGTSNPGSSGSNNNSAALSALLALIMSGKLGNMQQPTGGG
jgi:hypothetical protein